METIDDRIELAGKLMNNAIIDGCPKLAKIPMTRGWGELVVEQFKTGIKDYVDSGSLLTQGEIDEHVKWLRYGYYGAGGRFPHYLSSAIAWYKAGIDYAKEHYEWIVTGNI